MLVGVDVINEGSRRLIGCSASYNMAMTQYYTRVYQQKNPKLSGETNVSKDELESRTTETRTQILIEFFEAAIKNF